MWKEIIKLPDAKNVNIKGIKRIKIRGIKNGTILIEPNANKSKLKFLKKSIFIRVSGLSSFFSNLWEENNQTTRCKECYKKWRRNNVKNNVKKYREAHKM